MKVGILTLMVVMFASCYVDGVWYNSKAIEEAAKLKCYQLADCLQVDDGTTVESKMIDYDYSCFLTIDTKTTAYVETVTALRFCMLGRGALFDYAYPYCEEKLKDKKKCMSMLYIPPPRTYEFGETNGQEN